MEYMMDKMFTIAGTSVLDGVIRFRVANNSVEARTKILEKNGDTDIKLQALPKPMSKEDAMKYVGFTVTAKAPVAAKKATKAKAKPAPKAKAEPAPKAKAETKTPEEIEEIKAKNLETMRQVSNRNKELERKNAEVLAEFEKQEEEMEKEDLRAYVPSFLLKESYSE